MRIYSKVGLALLAVAVGLPAAYAQVAGSGQAQQQAQTGQPPAVGQRQGPMRGPRGWMGGQHGWMRGRRGWGPGHRMGMRARGRGGPELMLLRLVNNPELRQRVGITSEQAAKIRQQITDFQKEQIHSRANIQVQRMDLRNLMAAEKPDRAAINAALEQMSSLRLAQTKAAVDFHLAMRDALTPEQRQKLMQMRGEFMRRGPGMMGPRGPRRMMRPNKGSSPSPNSPTQN